MNTPANMFMLFVIFIDLSEKDIKIYGLTDRDTHTHTEKATCVLTIRVRGIQHCAVPCVCSSSGPAATHAAAAGDEGDQPDEEDPSHHAPNHQADTERR